VITTDREGLCWSVTWPPVLTWGYGMDMISTRVSRTVLSAAGDCDLLACVTGAVLIV